ncbi:alpha/beta hydrolase fold domain-containing protein [Pseudomonas sp. UBA4194]|uniref:alpha/beta hydrolase fold domain-containing protein n=1 Tax=Pseudomonas sp. UBA4194 TaxID=1947317 RepID=UPI0025F0288C|nr:alpha/beta hydrolase fold domain-containing protein [Pseudomonas sp. UBA4194]
MEPGERNIASTWPVTEGDLAQVQAFNRKLARLPRFRIRNRITPLLIQTLLRAGQIGGPDVLRKHELSAERKLVGGGGLQVPVRIIRPKGPAKGIVLDIHGGGWVIGNAQMNDDLNVGIVNACDVIVVSVDYRLAVTTPVQGLMQDCLCAARWLLSEQSGEFADLPVVLVGESAGGHLAAATLLALKQTPALLHRVRGALLYYGVYDLTGTPSVRAAGPDTLVLHGPGMADALRLLTPQLDDLQRQQAPLSPLYGDFTDMPPALMFVGELDPLQDDTLLLAERWTKSSDVEVHWVPASPHGFIHFPTRVADSVLAYSWDWINARVEGGGG